MSPVRKLRRTVAYKSISVTYCVMSRVVLARNLSRRNEQPVHIRLGFSVMQTQTIPSARKSAVKCYPAAITVQ